MASFPGLRAALATTILLAGCTLDDGNDQLTGETLVPTAPIEPTQAPEPTAAQVMLNSLGPGAMYFSEASMRALLDYEDDAMPVALLQLMTVDDAEGFTAYERSAEDYWDNWGGETVLATRVASQLFGDRPADVVRIVQFPNLSMFRQAMSDDGFVELMDALFTATSEPTWLLGSPLSFPAKIN